MFSSQEDQTLAIARLTRPHGVHGELSAIAHVPPVVDLPGLIRQPLTLRSPKGWVRTVQGESARPHTGRWLIKLAGVHSRNEAESLREHELCLRRDQLPELPEGWFWEADLLGSQVIDENLGTLGEVQSLEADLPQARLTIRRPNGGEAHIPWRKVYIHRVDLAEQTIHVDLPAEFPGISD